MSLNNLTQHNMANLGLKANYPVYKNGYDLMVTMDIRNNEC